MEDLGSEAERDNVLRVAQQHLVDLSKFGSFVFFFKVLESA